jgi:hypothetical protein
MLFPHIQIIFLNDKMEIIRKSKIKHIMKFCYEKYSLYASFITIKHFIKFKVERIMSPNFLSLNINKLAIHMILINS